MTLGVGMDVGILVVDGDEVVVIVFATNGDVPSRAVLFGNRFERQIREGNACAELDGVCAVMVENGVMAFAAIEYVGIVTCFAVQYVVP